jgi:RNA polymerase sigma factor (sigma-70 family)
MPRDLPPLLQEMYRTPLLTPARERALFLKFNFHKYEFVSARRRIDPQFARWRDVGQLESHLHRATQTKNAIVRANLRLVVSVARKHLRSGLTLGELMSEGTLTLMRAVEGFDVHKGNRFSTYATLALMKGFARSVPRMLAARACGENSKLLAQVPDARLAHAEHPLMHRDEVRRLLDTLDERERRVIRGHFGLGAPQSGSYDELAGDLGLSPQRVRQIERSALAKLRALAGGAR